MLWLVEAILSASEECGLVEYVGTYGGMATWYEEPKEGFGGEEASRLALTRGFCLKTGAGPRRISDGSLAWKKENVSCGGGGDD